MILILNVTYILLARRLTVADIIWRHNTEIFIMVTEWSKMVHKSISSFSRIFQKKKILRLSSKYIP